MPAASARMHVFDAVFTRMGASDNLKMGRSTFLEARVPPWPHALVPASMRNMANPSKNLQQNQDSLLSILGAVPAQYVFSVRAGRCPKPEGSANARCL